MTTCILLAVLNLTTSHLRAHPTDYGRGFAVKHFSKANPDEGLVAQHTEAIIHQSLPVHLNVVMLHHALETSAFPLLEFVPGLDLLFSGTAHDHYDIDPTADPALTHTPLTYGFLSSLRPIQLLEHAHLRLITSIFAQICEAVALTIAFLFIRAMTFSRRILLSMMAGSSTKTVSVSLGSSSNFVTLVSLLGNVISSDMDCGNAPYVNNCIYLLLCLFPCLISILCFMDLRDTWLPCISRAPPCMVPGYRVD